MAMTWKCILDNASVLTGYQQIDTAAVQPGDVCFVVKPDLTPGEYRWNGEMFVAAHGNKMYAPDGPDAWFAMYRLCRRLEKQNVINLPAPTKQWMDYYRQSFTNDPAVET
jgi:hypothetical protein